MSFENYVRHIAQKHRLAVALAVLKDKPKDVSIEKYIEDIKLKLNNDNDDSDICSNDFNIDDDVIIANDQTDNNEASTYCDSSTKLHKSIDSGISKNDTSDNTQESVSILNDFVLYDAKASNSKVSKDTANTKDSETLLKGFVFNDISKSKNIPVNNDLQAKQTQRHVKNTVHQEKSLQIQQCSDKTYYYTQMFNDAQNNYTNTDEISFNQNIAPNNNGLNTNLDSQATAAYSLHNITQNNTHISQNQYDNIVINENLFKSTSNKNILTEKDHTVLTNDVIFEADIINSQIDVFKQAAKKNIRESENETNKLTIACDNSNHTDIDTQETYEQYASFVPFSKTDSFTFVGVNTISTQNNIEHTSGTNERTAERNKHIELINEHTTETNVSTQEINENTTEVNEHTFEINECIEPLNEQVELVPFKVIEELNKIKSYLKRTVEGRMSNDGSMDSGYRTDSQSKNSHRSSSQSSGAWLNQSAHCLFDYITTVPMILTIKEITNEIAQILAQLIDILHEEEKYLAFLDDVLEYVETLIQEIYTGGNYEENVLLKKDELIHRLLLTNISNHIQKYTIEKLIDILEVTLPKLAKTEETYEISNTEQCENLCYIFHILEVILRRYMKRKTTVTNNIYQTELNRSSITDIWRRKWNPNLKITDNNSDKNLSKKCIITKCNEVLNKYVVNCMEAYSLVSYSALQCFNALQS